MSWLQPIEPFAKFSHAARISASRWRSSSRAGGLDNDSTAAAWEIVEALRVSSKTRLVKPVMVRKQLSCAIVNCDCSGNTYSWRQCSDAMGAVPPPAMMTLAVSVGDTPASSSVESNPIVYRHASPKVCELVSISSRGWSLGLGVGSGVGGLTRCGTLVSGEASPQAQRICRSSLPGSTDSPLNGVGTPAFPSSVGTP